MAKKFVGFILLLMSGIVCVTLSVLIIIQDVGFDLNKTNSIVGQVQIADIIRPNGEFRYPKRLFYFTLNNSEQKFTIYHSYEGYHELESEIKIGDTLKVYYRPKSSGYNRNVYQIEKNGLIVESYKTYYQQSSSNAVFPFLIGVMIIASSLTNYYKINFWKFLSGMADPTNKKNNG